MNHDFPWSHPVLFNYIIYITNIPIECQSLQLKKYLRGYGEVAWFRLFNSKFPSPKYAHLIFTNLQSYKDFLNHPVHMLDSAKLRVTMWKATPVNSKFAEELSKRKVFVKNLPTGFRFESVHRVLSRFGKIIDIDGVNSTGDDTLRNIAIAIFETEQQTALCLENQQKIKKETGFKVRPYCSMPKNEKPQKQPLESSSNPALQFESQNGGDVVQSPDNGMVPFVQLFATSKLVLNSSEFDGPNQNSVLPTASDFMSLFGEFNPLSSYGYYRSAAFEANQFQAAWPPYEQPAPEIYSDRGLYSYLPPPSAGGAPSLAPPHQEQLRPCSFKIPWKIAQQSKNVYFARHLTDDDVRYNLSMKSHPYSNIRQQSDLEPKIETTLLIESSLNRIM